MRDWQERVEKWARDRNLIEGSTPAKQLMKLGEEVDELYLGVQNDCNAEIRDAIGDVCVVLAIIATQTGLSFEDCLESAWDEIKDRRGKMVDGIFVKESIQ
jgi:NTP pyrophosphatase (non-canonical NTP hydrolase)